MLVLKDITKLDDFINTYQDDSNKANICFYIRIKRDRKTIKHSFLYPEVSNGPLEGTNNEIKTIRRNDYGRAGLELLNALAVLP